MLSNPISGGEVGVLVGVTALGFIVTDMLSRYLQTEPSGYTTTGGDVQVPNAASTVGMPSWVNIGAQALLSVVGFVGGGMASKGGKGGLGSAALYGIGLGAGTHLVAQAFTGLMARWGGSKTSATGTSPTGTLARLYSAEIAAQNAQYTAQTSAAAATPAGNAVPGFAGPPEGQLAAPPPQHHQPPQQQGQLGQYWGQPMNYPQAQQSYAQAQPMQVPPNYIYVAAQNMQPVNLGNGMQQCPDGSQIPVGTPCAPPAFVVLSNGQTQSAGSPLPPGTSVTGYYFAPPASTTTTTTTTTTNPGNIQQPAPPPYVPPQAPPQWAPPLPSCMPQPADPQSCGCMGFFPDTVFPD